MREWGEGVGCGNSFMICFCNNLFTYGNSI